MKIKLLRPARIRHNAGEIVEVSPAEAAFLLSVNSAVEAGAKAETPETEKRETRKKTVKK